MTLNDLDFDFRKSLDTLDRGLNLKSEILTKGNEISPNLFDRHISLVQGFRRVFSGFSYAEAYKLSFKLETK